MDRGAYRRPECLLRQERCDTAVQLFCLASGSTSHFGEQGEDMCRHRETDIRPWVSAVIPGVILVKSFA